MIKKIIAMLLVAATICALSACGGDETSKDTSTNDGSVEESSKAETSENEASEGNSSEENTDVQYKDKDGYQQYLAASKVDKVLAERGFKDTGANSDYVPLNYDTMKAAWISQFDFEQVYSNGTKQRSQKSFERYVAQAFDNLLDMGYNTVIVQVRPNADSFYPSAYYPASAYVVDKYGKNFSYDALGIMIKLAHEKGLSFHAWINPMRGMSSEGYSAINDAYVMKSWSTVANKKRCKDYIYLREADGLYYLNISYEEVRNLIINAAAEIVRNYDVDGVHMDDYFYFEGDEGFDNIALNNAIAKDSTMDKQKFRYGNLNALISGVYSAIKTENKNVMFGISPAGNLDHMATRYYADVRTWLSQDGYLDYIMPQIYFGMEHQTWSFTETYRKWSEITTNKNVKFMAGMTFGKALKGTNGDPDEYAGTGANEWINNRDVLKRCLEYAKKQPNFAGFAFFAYQYQFDALSGNPNNEAAEEIANVKPVIKGIKAEKITY